MTSACTEPVSAADLVDYWAGDLDSDRQDAVEAHLIGCAACTTHSGRIAAITETLRGLIPPIVSTEMLAGLRKRGLSVIENVMRPGDRKDVVFPNDVDVLIHRLSGLPLADAVSVRFRMTAESTGQLMAEIDDVPFDRATGSVLIACQKHYAAMPHDTVAEMRVRDRAGRETVHIFTILHSFEQAP